jgi:serine protease Do
LIRNADAIAAYSASKASDVIMSDFTSYSGMDILGGDYKRIRQTNYLECFVDCMGDNACRAFAYVSKKKECWLKNVLGRPTAAKGVDLGVK